MGSPIHGRPPVQGSYGNPLSEDEIGEGEKEEARVGDEQDEPLPLIWRISKEVIIDILKKAGGGDQPGAAQTLCRIRLVCHTFNELSDDVFRTDWIQLHNGRVPVLHPLVTAIEKRIGNGNLSYFSRFQELTRDFGRMGIPIPKEDPETAIQPLLGFQPLQYVEAYKELDASLMAIWPKIQEKIEFGQDPAPNNAAAIRQWLNDPENAGLLAQITELNLIGLRLRILPPEISKLTGLQELCLDDNRLTTLPPQIGDLIQLQTLGLAKNQLTTLPPEIGRLDRLQSLDLMENQLTILPPEIGHLIGLDKLCLHYNKLVSLPPEISNLKLSALYLEGNPLMSVLCLENPGVWKNHDIQEAEARENVARHMACSNYPCQSSFAALCQAIYCGVGDEALQEHLEALPPQIREKISDKMREKILDRIRKRPGYDQMIQDPITKQLICNVWRSTLPSFGLSSQPERDLFANRLFLAEVVISVVREKFRSANQFLMYERVWELAGSPALKGWQQSKCSWGKEHAADNIIGLIDAMESTASTS